MFQKWSITPTQYYAWVLLSFLVSTTVVAWLTTVLPKNNVVVYTLLIIVAWLLIAIVLCIPAFLSAYINRFDDQEGGNDA